LGPMLGKSAPPAPEPRAPDPEPAVAKPGGNLRGAVLWTAGILLALGLTWFVPTVAVPFFQARSLLREHNLHSFRRWSSDYGRRHIAGCMGSPERARLGLKLNLRISPLTPEQRLTALRLLGYCGKCAMPDLLEALGRKDQDARRVAAAAIGDVGPEARDAIPALIRALADGHAGVRVCAMLALGKIGPEARAAVPLLIRTLADTDKSHQSEADSAAEALGGIGPEAMPPLLELIASPDPWVRCRAVRALGLMGPAAKDALPAIEKVLREEKDELVLHGAAKAFMRMRSEGQPK